MPPHRRTVAARLPQTRTAFAATAAAVLALTLLVFVIQSNDQSNASPSGGFPPASVNADSAQEAQDLSELDKTFLTKVRQANLWEAPAADLAETHSSSLAVKRAGRHMVDGHSRLDQLVREGAARLGVQLPNQASAEQQEWLAELKNLHGAEFDHRFAQVLRLAHSQIFPVIAQVRVTTKSETVRAFAIEVNQAVLDHLRVLDDTGLVEDATLDEIASSVLTK
ncbi:DUF4142 domain-containing protein [Streptomyces sp. JJ36]|uniref:DUF4142 domain-containing protein n=1 Tax=Streptomyces sp. JJ36 TaxID=2736645 RepID=UPI001F3D2298|nr:DUF4142 domain-containing protein [Streptomyces sp. JJ36]MCF6523755.1 DUF4142 domain-containing protein [Streptomyces sp. JJ36]